MSAKNMMEETKVKLYDLKVNYQKNPMGIDLHNPVFFLEDKGIQGNMSGLFQSVDLGK